MTAEARLELESVDLGRWSRFPHATMLDMLRQTQQILHAAAAETTDPRDLVAAHNPCLGEWMTRMANKQLSQNLKDWVDARKRHHLSHAHIQMARELGMNPKNLGKIADHRQQPWKAPLADYIEHLYRKSFGRERPEIVMSIEERARAQRAKKELRKEAKRRARADGVDRANEASP